MKNVLEDKITLLFISFAIVLALAFLIYHNLNTNIQNYKYTDKEEFETVEKGLNFIKKLPIHFNILNQSFHNMDVLKQEDKEAILVSYYLKNGITNDCSDNEEEICIYEKNLEQENIFDKFKSKIHFKSNKLTIYVDGYGVQTLYKQGSTNNTFYRLHLKEDDKIYQIYSSFKYFKKNKDQYNFYIYQGYYNINEKDTYELHDLLTDKVVYKEKVNTELFENIKEKDIKKLQLYKYILKKDNNNAYYLYGYNPVKG